MQEGTSLVFATKSMYTILIREQNDMSPIVHQREFFITTGHPKPAQSHLALLRPFDRYVWSFLIITMAIFTFLFPLVFENELENDLLSSLMVVMSIFVSESVSRHMTLSCMVSRQIMLLFWLPTALLLCMAYQSNLLASLVYVQYEKPLETFEDILLADLDIHMFTGSQVQNIIKASANPSIQKLEEKVRILKVQKSIFFAPSLKIPVNNILLFDYL